MKGKSAILLISCLLGSVCFADNGGTTINNNISANTQGQGQASGTTCQNTPPVRANPPAGTYYQSNPRGGMDTVYTTGDKQPYLVDGNCNNSAAVQPYVYATPGGMPGPPGPTPGPDPRPGPRPLR